MSLRSALCAVWGHRHRITAQSFESGVYLDSWWCERCGVVIDQQTPAMTEEER